MAGCREFFRSSKKYTGMKNLKGAMVDSVEDSIESPIKCATDLMTNLVWTSVVHSVWGPVDNSVRPFTWPTIIASIYSLNET